MELVKNVKNGHNTYIRQVEWMDMEATSVDIDAIDTDTHARAGDVELILRATQRQRCCHVDGLLPKMIRIACSLSSRLMAALFGAAATAGAAGAADSSTPVGASSLSLL